MIEIAWQEPTDGDTGDLRIKTKAAAYGLSGLAVAGIIIVSGSAAGLLAPSSSGILSILFTDPPSVPGGVSAVYITYENLAVHAAGFGNSSGWVQAKGEGTFNAMKLVNLSETTSSDSIPALTYNLIRFNISSVEVEYLGSNYSAAVSSGKLTVPILGGLEVNSSSPAAALVDIQPTVLNLGDASGPKFTLAAGAKALQVPSGDVNASLKQVGHIFSLQGHGWFEKFHAAHADHFDVSGLVLSADSLTFSATNNGSDPLTIRMVLITPGSVGNGEGNVLSAVAQGYAFSVSSDGSLRLLNGPPGMVTSFLAESGYTLIPGTTHQFSYSGTISAFAEGRGITAGTAYYIVIVSSEAVSIQSVVAS